MKVKTKGVMIEMRDCNYESKTFRFYAMVSHFSLCVLCFSFLLFCLSASSAGAETLPKRVEQENSPADPLAEASHNANQVNEPSEKPQHGNTTSHPIGQLWQARVGVPEGQKDNRSKNELKRLIEQIRSIEFKPQKSPEPVIFVKPVPIAEPNKTSSDTQAQKEQKKEAEPKLPYEPIADQTLQILKDVSQDPNRIVNPFQLAEILFLSGHLKEAAVLYQEALNRIKADDGNSPEDRAWILFQIGNCLRKDDLPAAMKTYRQLITEYPNSLWADLAKTLDKLIDWYQKDKPRELITTENGVLRK